MRHATHCKFCKSPLTVEIDAEYSALGDPLKILGLAACNRCADLRVERRTLESRISFLCEMISQLSGKPDQDTRAKWREALTALTKRYARMVAAWLKATAPAWDEESVNLLMEQPSDCNKILSTFWRLYKTA